MCNLSRQWAGNKADIDFESMVHQTNALLVANPIPAGPISEKKMNNLNECAAFMASAEWSAAFNQTTLSRIWCIGKLSYVFISFSDIAGHILPPPPRK